MGKIKSKDHKKDLIEYKVFKKSDDELKSKKHKKKKKLDSSSIDITTYNFTEDKKNKKKEHRYGNSSFTIANELIQNHELLETSKSMKPKKKKRQYNSSIDLVSHNVEKNIFEQNKVSAYDNNSSKECVTTETEDQNYELLNKSIDGISNINNESIVLKKSKKKKKYDKDVSVIDFATHNAEENEVFLDNNNSCPKECVTTEENHQNHELLDTSLDDVYNINNENFKSKKSKKRKKQHNSSIDSTSYDVENNIFEENKVIIDDNNSCIKEFVTTDTNKQNHAMLETSFVDITSINNETFKSMKPKKKKRQYNSSIDLVSHNVEKNIFEENKVPAYDNNSSKECVTTETEDQNYELLNKSIDGISNINNESIVLKKSKKKKKYDKDVGDIDFATHNAEENEVFLDNNNSCPKECVTTEKNHQNHELLDTSLGDMYNINNENFKLKKPKKRKKQQSSSIDSMSYDVENNIFEENKVSIDDNNSCIKEFVTTDTNQQNHAMLETSFDDITSINNETSKSMKPKKKKRQYNGSIEFVSYNVEKNIFEENKIPVYDNNSSKECVTTETEDQNYELLNKSFDGISNINNESIVLKKSKKKKKYDKDVGVVDFATHNAEENEVFLDNNNSCPKECVTTEKNHQNHELLDTSLGDMYNINNENFKLKKPKTENEHVNSLCSFDVVSNNVEKMTIKENVGGFIDDISNFESNNLEIQEKENQNHELLSIPSNNVTGSCNEIFNSNKTKKKKKHDKSLRSLDLTIINNTKRKRKLIKNTTLKLSGKSKKYKSSLNNILEEFTNIAKDIKSLQQNIIISDDNNTVQNSNNLISIDGDSDSKVISNANTTTVEHNVSQRNIEFEALQSTLDLHGIENSTNTETQVVLNLDIPELIAYVIDTKSSLKSNPDFNLIFKNFSSEIKKVLNKNCVNISPSEMKLLKVIGKKLLEKCVERHQNREIVNNLHIIVPSESKKNKTHYLETTLTKYPNKSIVELIKEQNPNLKLGVFNEEEDNLIKKYWLKFQQDYNISDVQPFIPNGMEIALPSSERISFTRYISAELPNRLLFSVYNRFVVLFDKKIVDKQSFNIVEDRLIMQVNNCTAIKNKYMVLNLLLNRTKQQLIRRSNSLKLQPSCKERINWNIEKRQELFSSILSETNTKNWTDLENLKIQRETWIKVAKKFSAPISDEKVRVQWKFLSTMLFCKQPIYYSTFKLNMLKILLEKNVKYWSDISWLEITNKYYPGANSKVIYTIFEWWVFNKVPVELRSDVRGSLNYLATKLDYDIEKLNENRIKCFPRFTVTKNNKLKLVKDDF